MRLALRLRLRLISWSYVVLMEDVGCGRGWTVEEKVCAHTGLRERDYVSNGLRLAQDGHEAVEACDRSEKKRKRRSERVSQLVCTAFEIEGKRTRVVSLR